MSDTSPNSDRAVQSEVISVDPLPRIAPGYKTTEFWLAVAFLVLDAAAAISEFIPAEHAAVFAVIVTFGYKALRTLLKITQSRNSLTAYLAELDSAAAIDPAGQFVTRTETPEGWAPAGAENSNTTPAKPGQDANPGKPTSDAVQAASAARPGAAAESGFAESRTLAAGALICALLLAALLYLSGCARLDGYDRTYSLNYVGADGQQLGTSVTLRPAKTGGFAK